MKASTLLDEFHRCFFREGQDGVWLGGLEKPMPTVLSMEDQIHHLSQHAYLADCNESLACMYGYEAPSQLIGLRFPQFFLLPDPTNIDTLERFLASGLRIHDAISHGRHRNGTSVHFLNSWMGVVDKGKLIRVWGIQRRITDVRLVRVLKELNCLSAVQRTIFNTTIQGMTLKEIAAATGLAVSTVETHRKRLLKKLGLHSMQELLLVAGKLHLE
ncbi:MAG TPA: PAS and helix-turn-helix domain-containing protein [Bacteroidota bacterium]|nr:PAS and helix-turn-helix domain-containing protein [Bacteroidota bacterium]